MTVEVTIDEQFCEAYFEQSNNEEDFKLSIPKSKSNPLDGQCQPIEAEESICEEFKEQDDAMSYFLNLLSPKSAYAGEKRPTIVLYRLTGKFPGCNLGTPGLMFVYDENGKLRGDCQSLEPGDLDNKPWVSCIPGQEGRVEKRYTCNMRKINRSDLRKRCGRNDTHEVMDVDDRSAVLLHPHNPNARPGKPPSAGCLLPVSSVVWNEALQKWESTGSKAEYTDIMKILDGHAQINLVIRTMTGAQARNCYGRSCHPQVKNPVDKKKTRKPVTSPRTTPQITPRKPTRKPIFRRLFGGAR